MLQIDAQINKRNKGKKDKKLKLQLKNITSIIRKLEIDFIESQKNDRLLLMAVRRKATEYNSLKEELDKSHKENNQIFNMIQLNNEDGELSRDCSKTNLGSSISTISLVHLQYKYEELLKNHRGLLKILDLRSGEAKKCLKENQELQNKIQKLTVDLGTFQDKITFLKRKLSDLKQRKNEKLYILKAERQTLALVHRRLVALLHRQCMEKNNFIESLLKTTTRSEKALLLQEIRKNNILAYENFQLQQELQYLKSLLNLSRTTSKDSITVNKQTNSKDTIQSKHKETVQNNHNFLKGLSRLGPQL